MSTCKSGLHASLNTNHRLTKHLLAPPSDGVIPTIYRNEVVTYLRSDWIDGAKGATDEGQLGQQEGTACFSQNPSTSISHTSVPPNTSSYLHKKKTPQEERLAVLRHPESAVQVYSYSTPVDVVVPTECHSHYYGDDTPNLSYLPFPQRNHPS